LSTGAVARKADGPGVVKVHTEGMAVLVPLAHTAHWLWALYLPPILIVLGSILRTTLSERRKKRDD